MERITSQQAVITKRNAFCFFYHKAARSRTKEQQTREAKALDVISRCHFGKSFISLDDQSSIHHQMSFQETRLKMHCPPRVLNPSDSKTYHWNKGFLLSESTQSTHTSTQQVKSLLPEQQETVKLLFSCFTGSALLSVRVNKAYGECTSQPLRTTTRFSLQVFSLCSFINISKTIPQTALGLRV